MRARPGSPGGAWSARDVVNSVDASGTRVLLHLPTGTYLGLDRSAARIVDLLNSDPDPRHAAEALAQRFGIPIEQALGDVGAVVAAVRGLSAERTDRGRRPTVAGVRVVTQSWWQLPWRFRMAVVQAAMVVVAIEIGLAVFSLSRLARMIRVPLATDGAVPPLVGPDDLSGLNPGEQRAHWAVQWVLARWIYDATCLRRALAFGWFLRRRDPVLRLGMIDDQGATAHAWIEVDGRAFNASTVTGSFVTGAVPSGPAQLEDPLAPPTARRS
jgi:Transglutaminase-like superfamily/Coenzyme PQQ synthesis protein D (PqqD)